MTTATCLCNNRASGRLSPRRPGFMAVLTMLVVVLAVGCGGGDQETGAGVCMSVAQNIGEELAVEIESLNNATENEALATIDRIRRHPILDPARDQIDGCDAGQLRPEVQAVVLDNSTFLLDDAEGPAGQALNIVLTALTVAGEPAFSPSVSTPTAAPTSTP